MYNSIEVLFQSDDLKKGTINGHEVNKILFLYLFLRILYKIFYLFKLVAKIQIIPKPK